MKTDKAGFFVHETAHVSGEARIGQGTKIWHEAQVESGAVIGKKCVLGKGAYVGPQVRIGDCVKIQNRASVYEGSTIEDDVFIGPHVIITNDLRPRAFVWSEDRLVKTLVKKGASLSAGVILVCGVTVGEYAMVGAGSVVTKSVPDHALVYGNPAKLHGFVCRCGAKLSEMASRSKEQVVFKCSECGEETRISAKDYAMMLD